MKIINFSFDIFEDKNKLTSEKYEKMSQIVASVASGTYFGEAQDPCKKLTKKKKKMFYILKALKVKININK